MCGIINTGTLVNQSREVISLEEQVTEQMIGNVKISEDVVATIAGLAAAEVQGVASMSASLASGIYDLIGKKNLSKGVKIEIQENEVTVDLYLVVEYGAKIPEVALNVQQAVKKNVETMTGLNAVKIDVHVQGVKMEKEELEPPVSEPQELVEPAGEEEE